MTVRFWAIGGLGEIGMNCSVIEQGGSMVMLECGVSFPDDDSFGIDQLVPDFQPVITRGDALKAVLITHGHQDHIGAMPFLLRQIKVPIFLPRFAAGLLEHQLSDVGLDPSRYDIRVVRAGDVVDIGPFRAEFIHVNHSIPDTLAVALKTSVGTIVHTADFKIDADPFGEPPIDLDRFRTLGDEGVRALLSDSTNIERAGRTTSERDVRRGLGEAVATADGRVLVTLFSTNIFRIQALVEIAIESGRRLLLLGRSLQRNVEIARDAGIVKLPADVFVDEAAARNLPGSSLIIALTGSQAQPRAALARMAFDQLAGFRIASGDRVVFSARSIPGNEDHIARLKDQIVRRGGELYEGADVHCSGHAKREEQADMIRAVRPEVFVPVHGDYRYLRAHADLASELGVGATHALDNGDILEIGRDRSRVVGTVAVRRLCVDQTPFAILGGDALRERKRMAQRGAALIVMVVNSTSGALAQATEIENIGLFDDEFDDGLLDAALDAAEDAFNDLSRKVRLDEGRASEAIRLAVTRRMKKETGRKPHVIPVIVYV